MMKVEPMVLLAACFICCSLFVGSYSAATGNHLHAGFYRNSCPQAEKIAGDVAKEILGADPTLAASILRLFFHDCFVNGCDASILLDTTKSGEPVEKTSPANGKTLRGFEMIDEIKARIETACPGIVSCADILAFATRDAAVFSGLPNFIVPAGRRDGLSSRATDVIGNIPFPTMTVGEMTEIFTRKGMTVDEMVVLTGAHSIGRAQCDFFDYRLYNYSENEARDPRIEAAYAYYLSVHCPPLLSGKERGEIQVNFDPSTPLRLDNSFYLRLKEGRVLLQSDQDMVDDPTTRDLVQRMGTEPRLWSRSFARAMVRLSRLDVLTGNRGEIRRNCRAVN